MAQQKQWEKVLEVLRENVGEIVTKEQLAEKCPSCVHDPPRWSAYVWDIKHYAKSGHTDQNYFRSGCPDYCGV